MSLKQEGVTLIQGPPGTGKTKTVLGTLSVLLQSSLNREE
jgi:senataxin